MSDRDYYEILGLTPSADGVMVDQAYWHLVRKYQQLAATNYNAQRMIDELNEAYGVLGNPKLREQYDAFRDDVLIRSGMLKPVSSKPKPQKTRKPEAGPKAAKAKKAKRERNVEMPSVALPDHWRTYAVAGVIALLAFAAAWQGVNIVLVVVALAVGLGLALAPTLTQRISELSFEMPSVDMPDIKVPRVDIPKVAVPNVRLRELSGVDKEEGIDADTLSHSTRQTIARWRQSVGLRVHDDEESVDAHLAPLDADDIIPPAPDADVDPFSTVMDILRSGAKATPDRTRQSR